ncbi:MAG: FecR domain-containing protein [Rhodospirillales bacterium]|nr:FecR domain-containing protein [Rhodospirillales bacterium]
MSAVAGAPLVVAPSGFTGALAAGETVSAGEIIVTGADASAVMTLAGGATLHMAPNSRVVLQPPADAAAGPLHVVVLSGAVVLDASASASGAAAIQIDTLAASVSVDGAAVAISYDLASGLKAAQIGATGPAGDGTVAVANDGGTCFLHPETPAVAVEHWSDPPQLLSEGSSDGLPAWMPDMAAAHAGPMADLDVSATAGPAAEAVAADPGWGAADSAGNAAPADDAPAFSTGAGLPEAGDVSFVFPQAPAHGMADHAAVGAPLSAIDSFEGRTAATVAAPATPRPSPFAAPDHGLDVLVGLQHPDAAEPPLPPRPPGPPQLSGWEPTGHVWDYEGSAWVSGGDREWPSHPDRPMELIRPVEGDSMVALAPHETWATTLETFLGLSDRALSALVDDVVVYDGSAIRTSMDLRAGQTLVFDVLFDPFDNLPANDFAAFTVADGKHGEAFVVGSVAATGSLGATPWQTLEYTVGAAGRYSIGFVVINDFQPQALSHLYVDNLRDHFDGSGLVPIGGEDDRFGGHFALFEPAKPAPEPSQGELIAGFDERVAYGESTGMIDFVQRYDEPDGARGSFTATDGEAMAVLHAHGASRYGIEQFLGLQPQPGSPIALPFDIDGTAPAFGAATRVTLAVAAGDRISFDWLFDAGDSAPDNDFAVFTVAGAAGSTVFKLCDVRTTGDAGASGWHTSVYTAAGNGEVTVGFAVLNDRVGGYATDTENSRLLVDNVRLNRDFTDGFQTVDLLEPGALATLPEA